MELAKRPARWGTTDRPAPMFHVEHCFCWSKAGGVPMLDPLFRDLPMFHVEHASRRWEDQLRVQGAEARVGGVAEPGAGERGTRGYVYSDSAGPGVLCGVRVIRAMVGPAGPRRDSPGRGSAHDLRDRCRGGSSQRISRKALGFRDKPCQGCPWSQVSRLYNNYICISNVIVIKLDFWRSSRAGWTQRRLGDLTVRGPES